MWLLFWLSRLGIVIIGFFVLMAFAVGLVIYQMREMAINHAAFQKEYGAQWQARYEERHGPLSEERVKVAIGFGGLATMGGIVYLISRQIGRPTGSLAARSGGRRHRRR